MHNIFFKNYKRYSKGFGILEVMISAVIIITILTALVFIGKTALANSVYVQQRAQATYLAQEGIELVRQIRDTNWIDGSNATQWNSLEWNAGSLTVANNLPTDYAITLVGNRFGLKPSPTSADKNVAINGVNYSRTVTIASVGGLLPNNPSDGTAIDAATNALKVTVNVTFNNITGDKTISASEVITNWRPNY